MRFFFRVLTILFIFSPLWAQPDTFYHIEYQDNQSMVIDFQFPDPEISSFGQKGELSLLTIPGLSYNYEEVKPLLPVFTGSLVVPSGKASWQILNSTQHTLENVNPLIYSSLPSPASSAVPDYAYNSYPAQIFELRDIGLYRDYRLMGLIVYPVQLTSQGAVFYKSFRCKIQFSSPIHSDFSTVPLPEKKLLEKVTLNGSSPVIYSPVSSQTAGAPPEFTRAIPFNQQAKLVVGKKGIYRVAGQDLLDAGIAITEINPQTFRLTNKGNDVAVFISGERDGSFDPEDYIEFFGDRNEKTFIDRYPDVYTDPFSDDNVYWLSWGGLPGIRIVEESGSIANTIPGQYNLARYYPYTVHLEKDTYFARFGYANTGNLSYIRDAWFYDYGIMAVSKKSYPVSIAYPDSTPPARPVYVKMAFAGHSNSQHTLMAWLNNRLIGQINQGWYGEGVKILDNSQNPTITSLDLFHGTNQIEIQLPAAPDSGSDNILFNWADITYDRQYKAVNNYIEFSRPSPADVYYPGINLFQFEITRFTRPDIEIYKKGISKIVNYSLAVEGGSKSPQYKITFQDEIFTDNVEYIAIASDAKLKPKAIIPEKPFNQEYPERTLKDPVNSADYLIITHEKFYERALDLAMLRQNRGLNVVTVKVQDIYDEFNYGIKSPLAIKEFLKYVFYNWDRNHRLKYLLLLGDANYNYKLSGVSNEDLVPTFFYQSTQFGAVATDLPYALVAGNDVLPDIFVGRLPVVTNGELINVMEKIRDHEESPVIGPWRNQCLFISGNDRSTYELPALNYIPKKPAFRAQNQRVIDMLLDKNYSAFKLNTIKNDSLLFDPNFGGTTDLIDYFDNGVGFINFLGHGGGGIWADVQLMNLQDIERLNNKGKYPFITSMTCFTGGFDNPGKPALAQRLLTVPDKGAIGVLASSGLGWVANDYAMLWNVMKNFFRDNITLGEATTLGKIDYFVASQYVLSDTIIPGSLWGHPYLKYDMIYQYNLIGDPYVSIERSDADITISVDNDLPLPDDTISVTVQAPFSSAQGYLELADGNNDIVVREPLFYTGTPVIQDIQIPPDFKRGAGIVRAYLSDNSSDATGFKQIGVNYTVFDSVITIPAQPNAEDSVRIALKARDDLGLSQVKVVAVLPTRIVPNDTLHLSTIETDSLHFITRGKIPPTRSLSTVYYFVYATNKQGQQSRMSYRYDVQETRPDPFLYPASTRLAGPDKVNLSITLGNNGIIPANNVEVTAYNGYSNYKNNISFDKQLVSVDGKDSISVSLNFPFSLDSTAYKIYTELDPDQKNPDFNRLNNLDSSRITVNMYNLTPQFGSSYQNTHNDTILINKIHMFWLGPNSISVPSAVRLVISPLSSDLDQKKLVAVPFANVSMPEVLMVNKLNKSAVLSAPFYLGLLLNSEFLGTNGYSAGEVNLYRWDERMRMWLQQTAQIDTGTAQIMAGVMQDGIYAPFISGDKQPPQIKLTIDGQRIKTNSLVAPDPTLNILIEDESGINIHSDRLLISIDDIQLPPDKVFIPDSVQQSNVLGITAYPELDLGKHNLLIEATDVNGNTSRENFTLQVSNEFELHVFGNFPNPFTDETVFSYFISNTGQIIDDLEIRIFTVSGRLIRVIKNDPNTSVPGNDPKLVGYNELVWNGRDESGNEVANGVYFALVRARFEDKEKQQILKVAKLRR